MQKEILAALIGGASVIVAAAIGIISLDITPTNIANNKSLEKEYSKLSEENNNLQNQNKDLEQKFKDISSQYESLVIENNSIKDELAQIKKIFNHQRLLWPKRPLA